MKRGWCFPESLFVGTLFYSLHRFQWCTRSHPRENRATNPQRPSQLCLRGLANRFSCSRARARRVYFWQALGRAPRGGALVFMHERHWLFRYCTLRSMDACMRSWSRLKGRHHYEPRVWMLAPSLSPGCGPCRALGRHVLALVRL